MAFCEVVKMTRFEDLQTCDIEKMARIICGIEAGAIRIPTKYYCDIKFVGECISRGCFDCYVKYLRGELK